VNTDDPERTEGKPADTPGEALRAVRLAKWQRLRETGHDPFRATRYQRSHLAAAVIGGHPANEGETVRVAGRVMALRRHGQAAFLDLVDPSGRVQLYVTAESPDPFGLLDALDLGDHLGAEGTVFKTRRGEVSVRVTRLDPLSKNLRGVPDKRHGLTDPDLRYRQRYLDLLSNPDSMRVFRLRSDAVRLMRAHLEAQGFVEVETPVLVPIPGGGMARPFVTHHNALRRDLYLRIATELYLKRLIIGGMERVFEIGRVFRNEGVDANHGAEFTMLELYWAYVGYEEIMDLTEKLLVHLCRDLTGSTVLTVDGVALDFTPPFARVDMTTRFRERTGIELLDLDTKDRALQAARDLGIRLDPGLTRVQLLDKLVSHVVERELEQPTFLLHHPVDISPLAKRKADNPRLTERFELFCHGFELANAFTELNDPEDQRGRFVDQVQERSEGNDEVPELDEDFLLALEHGMPPTGGLGIGVDRVVMLLAGVSTIRDVVLFPMLRDLGAHRGIEE
jgi:lysyl-tRNA synthetase class 2